MTDTPKPSRRPAGLIAAGAIAVLAAIYFLCGLWWMIGTAGLVLIVIGYAEAREKV